MAEAQARAEAQPFEFHVPLSDEEPNDAVVEAEDTESDAADDAGEPEQAEASGEELFPAEELGVDENSPEYQALRKKFIAAYQKKLEAERKKLKPNETAPAAQPATEQQPAAQQPTGDEDPFDAIYDIDFKSVRPTLTFREGSDLAEYGDELTDLLSQAVDQKLEAAINGIRANDKKFRQQMTQAERMGKARDAISAYAQAIQDHPEYADKANELAAFAQKTQSLAIEDPETWIDVVERKFGLDRNWRGTDSAETRAQGQMNQRLATKPLSVVKRPTRNVQSNAAPTGRMDLETALQRAFKSKGL